MIKSKKLGKTHKIVKLYSSKKDFILHFLIPLVAFLFVIIFVISPSHPSSGSMEPTIMTNAFVLENKIAYKWHDIERGDIINFRKDGIVYGKRVIGTAGDHIEFHDGYVYINDELLDESDYIPDYVDTNCVETFDVPTGCVFVMGDNREDSYDSRFWEYPYISTSDVISKVIFFCNNIRVPDISKLFKPEADDIVENNSHPLDDYSEDSNVKITTTTSNPIIGTGYTTLAIYDNNLNANVVGLLVLEELYEGNAANEIIKSYGGRKQKASPGTKFVVARYSSTIDPRELYIDCKLLDVDGSLINYNQKEYSSRCYDIYSKIKKCNDCNLYENIYVYFEVPIGIKEYLLKFGEVQIEEFTGINTTANFQIITE